MKIQLKDQAPVQKNYNCIPKPFHNEIKTYVENFMNRGWIISLQNPTTLQQW